MKKQKGIISQIQKGKTKDTITGMTQSEFEEFLKDISIKQKHFCDGQPIQWFRINKDNTKSTKTIKRKTMTTKQAIEILVAHNNWRRGGCSAGHTTTEVGLAIDKAISVMKKTIRKNPK